jgi:GTPase SAR1 family protein
MTTAGDFDGQMRASDMNHLKTALYKFAILGLSGVGKSALVCNYLFGQLRHEHNITIEDIYNQQVTIDGMDCEVEVLDTAGREELFYKQMISTSVLMRKSIQQLEVKGIRSESVTEGTASYLRQEDRITDRDAIVLVYDITEPESFGSLEGLYKFVADSFGLLHQSSLAGASRPFPPVLIVGNKSDLAESR